MTRGQAREQLVEAAAGLFASTGYDRTTTREIAQRAGADPALITRYFGGKAGLYLAVLDREPGADPPPDLLQPERMLALLHLVGDRGPGPVLRTVVQTHDDPDVQAAVAQVLHRRLVEPLRERYARQGADDPQLRAELAAAVFAGIALARSAGALGRLAALPADELVPLVQALFTPPT